MERSVWRETGFCLQPVPALGDIREPPGKQILQPQSSLHLTAALADIWTKTSWGKPEPEHLLHLSLIPDSQTLQNHVFIVVLSHYSLRFSHT